MKTLADIFTGKAAKPEFRLYDVQIECAVCFSICFDSDVTECRECGWPLRPDAQKDAFGFEGVCRNADGQLVELHRVGGIARLRSAAKQKALTLLSFRAFDEKRWIQAFGNPAEKGL